MIRLAAIGLAAFTLFASFASADERPRLPARLTLAEAVKIAFQASPALRLADSSARRAAAVRDLANAERLPHFGITAHRAMLTSNLEAFGLSNGTLPEIGGPVPRRIGPYDRLDARAVVEQQIFNVPLRNHHRAEKLRSEAATSEASNVRELVAAQVAGAYVEGLRAQATAATLRKQLTLARQFHTITVDRFQQGVASGLDKRRSEQQALNLEQTLFEAEAALRAAKLRLAAAASAQPTAEFELADIERFYDTSVPGESEVVTTALANRTDYQAIATRIEAAGFDLKSASGLRTPRVSFYADFGQSGLRLAHNVSTYRIQGNLEMPLYFGGRAGAEERSARTQIAALDAQHEALRNEIETEALTAYGYVASALRQLEVAGSGIELAREEVDLAGARFVEGVADNSEVVAAQDRLTRAEGNRIRALYNLNVSRVQLHKALGQAEKVYRR